MSNRKRIRRAAAAALLAAVPAGAVTWTQVETDSQGTLRYAEGIDEAGRPLRLAYATLPRQGGFEAEVIFHLAGDTLVARTEVLDGEVRGSWQGPGAGLVSRVSEGPGRSPDRSDYLLPDGAAYAFRSDLSRSTVADVFAIARGLSRETPFLQLARAYLETSSQVPAPRPWTADGLIAPFLDASPGAPEAIPETMPLGTGRCYQDCVDACPEQCQAWCTIGIKETCITCMHSCNVGCMLGCGCVSCGPGFARPLNPQPGELVVP